MTIDAEDIVQIALNAHSKIFKDNGKDLESFELELRRALMQRQVLNKVTTYTYTTNPGTLTGTWSSKQILNG